MERRFKHLFHRRKGDDSRLEFDTPLDGRQVDVGIGTGIFRHSFYDDTVPGSEPEMGPYPKRGNNTPALSEQHRSQFQPESDKDISRCSSLADDPESGQLSPQDYNSHG